MGTKDFFGPTGGCVNDAVYKIHDGLVTFQIQKYQANDLVEYLRSEIKTLVRKDDCNPEHFIKVHRMSRMCFELLTDSKLSNCDRLDAELLYSAPQDEKFEWIFRILNQFKSWLRETSCSIVVADHVAKDIENIMTS